MPVAPYNVRNTDDSKEIKYRRTGIERTNKSVKDCGLGRGCARGRVHARAQVFLALCLRLVAITNYERGDNPRSAVITVWEEFYDIAENPATEPNHVDRENCSELHDATPSWASLIAIKRPNQTLRCSPSGHFLKRHPSRSYCLKPADERRLAFLRHLPPVDRMFGFSEHIEQRH